MIHQADHKNVLKKITLFAGITFPICIILSFFEGIGMIYFFFLLTIYYVLVSLFTRQIKSLEIDTTLQKVVIIKTGMLIPSKKIALDISSLTYSYKKEAIAKFTSGKCLRLYVGEKRKLKLSRMDSGWDEDKIDEIVKDLGRTFIQRKFVGYNLKDVYPNDTK
jgi:hypothetical protein